MPTLIFDCDGVLAETERDGHRRAFNQTFAEFGLPIAWTVQDYATMLAIGGGKERMLSALTPQVLRQVGRSVEPEHVHVLVTDLYRRKSARFVDLVRAGLLPARPGVERLASEARERGWSLAVASTSGEPSVRAVLEQVMGALAGEFTVFAGDIVAHKKPAPDIYRLVLTTRGISPQDAVVVEDSSNGLQAARGAGLATVVTTSGYTVDEDFGGAALVVSSLGDAHEPARVVADPHGIGPGDQIGIADLETVLHRAPQRQPQETS